MDISNISRSNPQFADAVKAASRTTKDLLDVINLGSAAQTFDIKSAINGVNQRGNQFAKIAGLIPELERLSQIPQLAGWAQAKQAEVQKIAQEFTENISTSGSNYSTALTTSSQATQGLLGSFEGGFASFALMRDAFTGLGVDVNPMYTV